MGKASILLLALATLLLKTDSATLPADDLPTNYEYYAGDGVSSGLNADQKYFLLNGKNITIFSGAFHYFRVHPSQWRDRLRKMRAAGLNTVETYVSWNLHEYQSGQFDFGHGGSDFEEFLDIVQFIQIAYEEDLFVLVRSGPYICSEFEFGGLPSWLLRSEGIKIRTNDEVFVNFVARFWKELFGLLSPLQFTKGGPIIGFQVENEYGNTGNSDPDYLRALVKIYRDNGITELLYTSDPPSVGTRGALPNELLMTANFNKNPSGNLNALDKLQDNKPTMTMEYWSGWFDHVTEDHHTVSTETYSKIYEQIITHPASVNIYMFVGSTNFGFTNGASSLHAGLDNSGLQPDTTSYDYDAPISEAGEITEKFTATAKLVAQYNPVKTKLPDVPSTPARVVFDDIKINEQILLSEIIDSFPDKIASENVVSMEQLPINNNSGQSFGYVVYRKTNLNLNANDVLKITGYVRDHVLVLLNGKLLTPVLSSKSDLDKFGYWRVKDSTITLTSEALTDATLDLVVENNARNNYGSLNQFQQFKGLIDDVLINDEVINNWQIIPLEFKRSWNKQLTGWHSIETSEGTPALYRVTFNATSPLSDTYVNVQEWRKGIVIINGFVLGRIFAVGPQQALYLPAGLLQEGENEIIVFEHFSAPEYVKFSADPIWGVGTHIN
ncbi:beta-galactosidase-1-like protein 2 [Anthonomus grandis grandis]|uniref:beta-galactosidase-1-like protein 2 n=1 Tax=Anthonomus grandis grandis TaxID=2921223 RepID=UPI0021665BCB|nr:beta-galactosidase-1-like protein 2 [Anthonomus grandis grandis]